MKKACFVLIATLLAVVTAHADTYTVTIDQDTLRRALIEVDLVPQDGRISLNRHAGDTGLLHGWATFVHRLQVVGPDGAEVALAYESPGRWRLRSLQGSRVNVRYEMLLLHDRFPNEPGDDELAYARDWGVMWTGRALFLEGAEPESIEVRFDVSPKWKVTSPWQPLPGEPHHFRVANLDDLLESAFMAGTHHENVIEMEDVRISIGLGGRPAAGKAGLISSIVERYLKAYVGIHGAPPPGGFALLASDATFTGGGVMGQTSSMLFEGKLKGPAIQMLTYVTAHEMYHLWNANHRYDEARAQELQWAGEGFAEYYTFLTALRIGDIGPGFFLGQLAERYGKYLEGPDGTSLAAAGGEKMVHYDLVYSGGMMAAFSLDLLIREATGNERSLDDVLQHLTENYPADGERALSPEELVRAIREATGFDGSSFFERHDDGTEPLPVPELARVAGLELVVAGEGSERSIRFLPPAGMSAEQEAVRLSLASR